MNVASPTDAKSASVTPASAAKAQVDYQSFLKLLVTEMKNQDPTKPMDATQYVAQLATFSQVEQAVQTNTKLDRLLQSSALAQADGIIGRTITSADGEKTGTAAQVRLGTDGLVAVLADGSEVQIGTGVVIGGVAQ
jgi:flagellar basal-body rod modification protein FlgD